MTNASLNANAEINNLENLDQNKPIIYVACLAAYNNGYLHGKWIDATQGKDKILTEIKEMLASSPISDSEEFAIHGYSDFFDLRIEEYDSIDYVADAASLIAKHGELGAQVLDFLGSLEDVETYIEDYYVGEYKSEVAFADELLDEVYGDQIPDFLTIYIDTDFFARDLFINDYRSYHVGNSVHVFHTY